MLRRQVARLSIDWSGQSDLLRAISCDLCPAIVSVEPIKEERAARMSVAVSIHPGPDGPTEHPFLSQAVRAGDFVFVSGNVGNVPGHGASGEGSNWLPGAPGRGRHRDRDAPRPRQPAGDPARRRRRPVRHRQGEHVPAGCGPGLSRLQQGLRRAFPDSPAGQDDRAGEDLRSVPGRDRMHRVHPRRSRELTPALR